MKTGRLWVILLLPLLWVACNKKPQEHQPTPYDLVIARYFPTTLNIPSDNPLTVEGVALGRKLFYDTRIRGYIGTNTDSVMCCASCHRQENGFDLGADNPNLHNGKPTGVTGQQTHHNAMPLCNLVFNNEGYFWNGSIWSGNANTAAQNLEDIVRMAITAADELNATPERVARCFRQMKIT